MWFTNQNVVLVVDHELIRPSRLSQLKENKLKYEKSPLKPVWPEAKRRKHVFAFV